MMVIDRILAKKREVCAIPNNTAADGSLEGLRMLSAQIHEHIHVISTPVGLSATAVTPKYEGVTVLEMKFYEVFLLFLWHITYYLS